MKTLTKAGAILALIIGFGLVTSYAESACKSCKECVKSCSSCKGCSDGNCSSCCQ